MLSGLLCSIFAQIYINKENIDKERQNKYNKYIIKSITKLINEKKIIKINLCWMDNSYKLFKSLFFRSSCSNLLSFDVIYNTFTNCKKIIFNGHWGYGKISSLFICELNKILFSIFDDDNNNKNKLKSIEIIYFEFDDDMNYKKCSELLLNKKHQNYDIQIKEK